MYESQTGTRKVRQPFRSSANKSVNLNYGENQSASSGNPSPEVVKEPQIMHVTEPNQQDGVIIVSEDVDDYFEFQEHKIEDVPLRLKSVQYYTKQNIEDNNLNDKINYAQ